ncbi:MAG: phosphatase PAP2 family protein [Mycobacterium sp.]|nr:phosphatase PAP2 family protein [Mycobacterium sp.]
MTIRARWLTGLAAAVGYLLLWLGWLGHWSWPTELDSALLDSACRYGVAHPGWVRGWKVFCTVFGPWTFQMIAAVVAIVALVRRQPRTAIFLLVAVELSGFVTEIAKDLAHRARPLTALTHEPTWSFPSGHALGTIAGALALCAVLRVTDLAWRRFVVGLCAVIVLAVGVGRVVLNVHYPTDVLAGWLLGYLWILMCLPILASRRSTDSIPAGT